MAILKHIASKNADYGEAQRYVMFQYDENTNKPLLDENGELIPRKEYIMDGINCDPFTFDMECRELSRQVRQVIRQVYFFRIPIFVDKNKDYFNDFCI